MPLCSGEQGEISSGFRAHAVLWYALLHLRYLGSTHRGGRQQIAPPSPASQPTFNKARSAKQYFAAVAVAPQPASDCDTQGEALRRKGPQAPVISSPGPRRHDTDSCVPAQDELRHRGAGGGDAPQPVRALQSPAAGELDGQQPETDGREAAHGLGVLPRLLHHSSGKLSTALFHAEES